MRGKTSIRVDDNILEKAVGKYSSREEKERVANRAIHFYLTIKEIQSKLKAIARNSIYLDKLRLDKTINSMKQEFDKIPKYEFMALLKILDLSVDLDTIEKEYNIQTKDGYIIL